MMMSFTHQLRKEGLELMTNFVSMMYNSVLYLENGLIFQVRDFFFYNNIIQYIIYK